MCALLIVRDAPRDMETRLRGCLGYWPTVPSRSTVTPRRRPNPIWRLYRIPRCILRPGELHIEWILISIAHVGCHSWAYDNEHCSNRSAADGIPQGLQSWIDIHGARNHAGRPFPTNSATYQCLQLGAFHMLMATWGASVSRQLAS